MSFLTAEVAAPKVYVSYHREENRGFAEGMRDWIALRLGSRNLLLDGEIPPFVESFDYYVRDKVAPADVLIAVIGPRWSHLIREKMEDGQRDRVRAEIRAALEEGIVIAPICIDGATIPREIDLPQDLRSLLRYKFTVIEPHTPVEQEIETVIQGMQAALAQRNRAVSLNDFETLYHQFMEVYQVNDVITAMKYLLEIEALGEIPRQYRTFKLQMDQYKRELLYQVEQRTANPRYYQIKKLAQKNPSQAWEHLQFFLTEYPDFGDPEGLHHKLRPVPEAVTHLLTLIENPQTKLENRVVAGEELAWMGDPRPGVGVRRDGLPDIKWCKIPEGEFIFHYDKRLFLPTYYIARYPITYAQYQTFIDAGGYGDHRWWDGLETALLKPQPQEYAFDNHPRERLSWFEAVAFCRWLSAQVGYTVRLPTEHEWEKAARGLKGYIYPWGDEYLSGCANIDEVISGVGPYDLRRTTAVGIYPQGASSYGVYDMIGNIWEWCLNEYKNPKQLDEAGSEKRVLRGGSFNSDRLFAHTVRRRGEAPNASFMDFGLRVVTPSSPSPFG